MVGTASPSSLPGLTPQVGFTRLAAQRNAELGQARVPVQSIFFAKRSCEADGPAGQARTGKRQANTNGIRFSAQNTFVFGQELSQDRELVDRRFKVNVTQAA
jgi:hypothetical protein